MSKYIKLKDQGTIFHDASQDATVTGNQVVKCEPSSKVTAAIKGGVIEYASEKEYDSYQASLEGDKAKVKNDAAPESAKEISALKEEKESLVENHSKELEAKDEAHKSELESKDEAHKKELEAKDEDAKKVADEKDKEIESLKKQLEAKNAAGGAVKK